MRRIIFNKNKFFSEEDPPEEVDDDNIPEQPDEPTDYLHGIPATVLDLKDPLVTPDENVSNELVKNVDINADKYLNNSKYRDIVDRQVSRVKDNYLDAVSNFNKESAINHRLNELGSTDYDLAGESSRKFNPMYEFIEKSNAHAFEAPGIYHYFRPEKLNIGIKDYFGNIPEVISHELGHTNDPYHNNILKIAFGDGQPDTYGTKYTKDIVSDKYGNVMSDVWSEMQPNGVSESAFRHDHAPYELYADAAALRSNLFKSGAWNGKDPITEDMVNEYTESENAYRKALLEEHGFNIGRYGEEGGLTDFTVNQRLTHYLTPSQIVNLLNSSRRYSIK